MVTYNSNCPTKSGSGVSPTSSGNIKSKLQKTLPTYKYINLIYPSSQRQNKFLPSEFGNVVKNKTKCCNCVVVTVPNLIENS